MKYIKKNIYKKTKKMWGKNYPKVGIGKIKIKTWLVCFYKCSLNLELMLCNWNLTKLVYTTLVSSNCRA